MSPLDVILWACAGILAGVAAAWIVLVAVVVGIACFVMIREVCT